MKNIKKSWDASPYKSIKNTQYFDIYETLLAKYVGQDITFVEVGILNGGSLFMWRDYFGKNARIIGIDLNPQAKKWEEHGFEIFIGSQSDQNFWNQTFEAIGPIDVLLDDGGHRYHQQIITLLSSLPHINNGGMVMIEDVGTSYMQEFGGPSPLSFISYTKSLIDTINAQTFTKKKNEWGLHSIQYFEHLVAFHINRNFVAAGERCENNGEATNAADFRYQDNVKLDAEILSKLMRPNQFNA